MLFIILRIQYNAGTGMNIICNLSKYACMRRLFVSIREQTSANKSGKIRWSKAHGDAKEPELLVEIWLDHELKQLLKSIFAQLKKNE